MGACLVEKLTGVSVAGTQWTRGTWLWRWKGEAQEQDRWKTELEKLRATAVTPGRPGLQESWENWESVRKGAAAGREPGRSWLLSVGLRVLWSLETFALWLPVMNFQFLH